MKRSYILWVSTSLETGGGVASAIRTLQQTNLFKNYSIRFVSSHKDGDRWQKLEAYLRGLGQYIKFCINDRPALVHIHTSSDASFVRKFTFFWLAKLFGIPRVLHVHGGGFIDFYKNLPGIGQAAIRATLKNSTAVVALGDIWATRLQSIVPDINVRVVQNGIDLSGFKKSSKDPSAPLSVLFLGELTPAKGLFELLAAWAKVMSTNKFSATLLIAGHGDPSAFQNRTKTLDIENSVTFLGRLPREQARELMGETDVFVLPSYVEGQPMALLEAMAVSTAIVTTPVGGIPDMISNNENGLLVPAKDEEALATAIIKILEDPSLRQRLGAGALARVQKDFEANRVAEKIEALYENILGKQEKT